MEQQQESQQKASRKRLSSMSRNKHKVREEGETGGDRRHPRSSKGKSPMAVGVVDPAEQNSGDGNSTVAKVPLQKSVSKKGISVGKKRARDGAHDGSLAVLITKFVDLIKQTEDGVLDLDGAMATLQVTKRRMYDITRNLIGAGFIEKISNNRIQWKAAGFPCSSIQEQIRTLKIEESTLEERIREMEERLRNLLEDKKNKSRLRVNREDIINLPCFQNETLIAFKAPEGTRIQVPDPDEDGDFQERRYTLILQSNKGAIDLWLISPYEENLETTNPDGEAQPSIPETSRANENASISPLTQEIRGGIGEADASSQEDLWTELFDFTTVNNAGGYFLPLDTDLSIEAIRNLWAESEHDFNFLNDVQWLDTLVDTSTPPAQPPPSATVMPSVSTTIAGIDCYCWESMRRIAASTSTPQDQTLPPISIAASTSTPQDQTLPPISSATPSVLNMIADIDRYNLEMIDKDNVIASIRTPKSQTPPPINTAMPSIPNTIADISWGSMNMIYDDNATPSISTTQAQPQPPIDTSLPSLPNTIANIGWDSVKMKHEDIVMASINAPRAQTPPQINTMPSVPNTLLNIGWDSMETTYEDNFIANINASQAQTPLPANTAMPFVSNKIPDADLDGLNTTHEDNTMTSTNTQAQTTQPSATEMSSVSKTRESKKESVTRSMAEVSPNSEIAEVTLVAHERGPIYKVAKEEPRPK